MKNLKNKPPRGVIIAFIAIVVIVIVYSVLAFVFPEVFKMLNWTASE